MVAVSGDVHQNHDVSTWFCTTTKHSMRVFCMIFIDLSFSQGQSSKENLAFEKFIDIIKYCFSICKCQRILQVREVLIGEGLISANIGYM